MLGPRAREARPAHSGRQQWPGMAGWYLKRYSSCVGARPGRTSLGQTPRLSLLDAPGAPTAAWPGGGRCQPLLGCPGPAQPVAPLHGEPALHLRNPPHPSILLEPIPHHPAGPGSDSPPLELAQNDSSSVSGASHSPAAPGAHTSSPLGLLRTHLQLAASCPHYSPSQ